MWFFLLLFGFLLFLLFRPFTRDDSRAAMGVVAVFITAVVFLILGWSYIVTLGTGGAWIPWAGLIAFILITLFTVF